MSQHAHYTNKQLTRAYLEDLVVDIRCARRDGLGVYAIKCTQQFRAIWARRHDATYEWEASATSECSALIRAGVANVTAVRYDTPHGVFYTFFCKHGNQHQTRVETANCSQTDGTKCAEEFRAREGAK